MVDTYIDPGFKHHAICSKLALTVLRRLADSALIPFDLEYNSELISEALEKFMKGKGGDLLRKENISVASLEEKIKMFKKASDQWMERLKEEDLKNPLRVRILNDQLLDLERVFVL